MYNDDDYSGYPNGNDRQPEHNIDGDINYTEGAFTDNNFYENERRYDGGKNFCSEGQNTDRSYIPVEPEQNKKSGGSMLKKVAGIAMAGVLFGCVAGGTMVGVNAVGSRMLQPSSETEGGTESHQGTENMQSTKAVSAVPVSTGNDVSGIVEKVMPSVVAINNTTVYTQEDWFFGKQQYEVPGSGSGIIAKQSDEELLIITNNHVVADSSQLSVAFIDGTSVKAAVKGTDSDSDLAVVAVQLSDIPAETMSKIQTAELGDSDSLKMGQGVVAIGNALGQGQSVTVGYISMLDRVVNIGGVERTLLQIDAAINPGNSGGALLNMNGEVIGINAAKYADTKVEGIGYAIPISFAKDIIEELMNKTTKIEVAVDEQGYLGIQPQNIDSQMAKSYGMPQGIYVYRIVEDGAAAKSTLRERDIITKFNGETLRTAEDLQKMLTYYKGGTTITLTVQSLENGAYVERQVEVVLGYRTENMNKQ